MSSVGSLKLKGTRLGDRKGIWLINSSSPWASDFEDLKRLYESPFTAAVTTRTAVVTHKDISNIESLVDTLPFQSTFPENKSVHAHTFLRDTLKTIEGGKLTIARGSLNSYGYSPFPLSSYLAWTEALFKMDPLEGKPVLLSIIGTPDVVEAAIVYLRKWVVEHIEAETGTSSKLGVEINLSCPNIKGDDAPSGYDGTSIAEYVNAVRNANLAEAGGAPQLTIGFKLPPYTYHGQFKALGQALSSVPAVPATLFDHPLAFLSSTNTLGCSFWLTEGEGKNFEQMVKALPSAADVTDELEYDGTGGMAGESLHPISLGNVLNISQLLQGNRDERLKSISIIGIGGVMSGLSARRMQSAGAHVVGLATALGREGIDVFERIANEILDEFDSEDY
ncbi:hypothetical protein CBS101457_002825 [Exobasidium rhododendri]|nr:hypothetical protein CBS101457_002825 [Exobasidium rhododendri]